jgi:hypothetical protein
MVVSIAGATHISDGLRDGIRATYNMIPQQFVNGDYLQTNEYINGHLVYVKIIGTNKSAAEHVCIWKSPTNATWCVGKPEEYGLGRGYATIRIPKIYRHMDLYDLVEIYNDANKALKVDVCGRVHENKPMVMVDQPLVQISTKPLDAAIHDLHAAHLKYLERLRLIDKKLSAHCAWSLRLFQNSSSRLADT